MKARYFSSISIITFGFFASHALSDASEPWQLGLQDPATPIMESMLFFHNYLMMFLIAIGVFVSWMLGVVFFRFDSRVNLKADKFSHDSLLETFWTIVPAVTFLGIEEQPLLLLGPETAAQMAYIWAFSRSELRFVRRVAFRHRKALVWLATVLLGANCSGVNTTAARVGGVVLVGAVLLLLSYLGKTGEEPAPATTVVVEPAGAIGKILLEQY